MARTVEIVIGPAIFASALINGDYSGLNAEEEKALEKYLARCPGHYFVDCGEPYFSWSYDLHGGTARGGDLIEYTTLKERED